MSSSIHIYVYKKTFYINFKSLEGLMSYDTDFSRCSFVLSSIFYQEIKIKTVYDRKLIKYQAASSMSVSIVISYILSYCYKKQILEEFWQELKTVNFITNSIDHFHFSTLAIVSSFSFKDFTI